MNIKTNMRPELVNITPELAAEWLKYNTENRRLPVGNMKYYCRLIESGEFLLTHQGLAFTGDRNSPKRLIDGQTRLMAVVNTGITIQQWVFWNVSEHTFIAVDGGKSRSFIDHYGWGKKQISVVNTLYWMSGSTSRKITKTEADKIWEAFGDQFALLMAACPSERKSISSSAVKAGVILAMHQNPDRANEIADIYRNMILGNLNEIPRAAAKLFAKLVSVVGGGGSAILVQLPFTLKALTPSNWHLTKLYPPSDADFAEMQKYIKTKSGMLAAKNESH